MLKFRPSNLTQKRANIGFNELQLVALIEKGLNDNSLRGYLYKRSSPSAKWRLKWFLLFENLLFYFDVPNSGQALLLGAAATAPPPASSSGPGEPSTSSAPAAAAQDQQQCYHQQQQNKSPSKGASSALSMLIRRQVGPKQSAGKVLDQARPGKGAKEQLEPRRASASETLELGRNRPPSGQSALSESAEQPRLRKRLCSDPQSLQVQVGTFVAGAECVSEELSASAGGSSSSRRTLNSSSISGISGHFLAHNDLSIGRSTTTSAGKTATANYASLLSRKIGVIFLEGSYCERLLESCGAAPDFSPHEGSELNCILTLSWKKEGSKEYQLRTETEPECITWLRAISSARYSSLLNDKEQLEQKYLHLSQIIESESTAKWQYSKQCEELLAEIKKLREEICLLKRQESRSNHLRLVLSKSAALVDTVMRQQGRRQQRPVQQQRLESPGPSVWSWPMAVKRARSMEQEQEAQEMAVRRARRCTAAQGRLADGLPRRPAGSSARRGQSVDVTQVPRGARDDEPDETALSYQLRSVVDALNKGMLLSDCLLEVENSEELRKIKKVQGFFRGWLCRRRWKQIVQEYIKSPHAESMRKRNNLVFRMVECEEEYVEQLSTLISAFLRPIKMAASSQRPPLDHDELNSIFLNSETLLFLHQIFLKGLGARMESWPTLVLGDLFNMLLPMLTIYQEFVRNHHFSLQVLAECKQRDQFSQLLQRLEEKPQLNGRTLETFLTYPMHQIPRYIICLHEILAHTPHDHVERNSLYEAQTKLEELSRQMHEEVSETENIRQNLAIERMIIGGCDILLDVSQGILLQVSEAGARNSRARSRLTSFGRQPAESPQASSQNADGQARELVRQCFLFTNHLLLCTRTKEGKLELVEGIGQISLSETTLIESPAELQQEEVQQQQQPSRGGSFALRQHAHVCNSILDYAVGALNQSSSVGKRASTSSVPTRAEPELVPALQERRTRPSERNRIAGYLASKLSNLTGLSGSQAQMSKGSSSAPPSPLNRAGTSSTGRRNNSRSSNQRLTLVDYAGCDFMLLLDKPSAGPTSSSSALPLLVHLVAPNTQEKAAWLSDISQCIDNVHFNDLCSGPMNDSSATTINQSVRTDPRLYKDDVDIKFSRALNSCKLPQIRYASKERLFERLTDLRFLSIDFLNTFLLTYRVFTSAEDVLEALKNVHYNFDHYYQQQQSQSKQLQCELDLKEQMGAYSATSLSSLNSGTIANEPNIEKRGQSVAENKQQKMQYKPTSSALDLELEPQAESSRFLLAPNHQHQKRRSTISALTPITGSTSSSLVNLTSAYKSAANRTNVELANRHNQIEQAQNYYLDPLNSDRKTREEVIICSSEEDEWRSSTGERLRSFSMSNSRKLANSNVGSNTSLNVPGIRQARASSISLTLSVSPNKVDPVDKCEASAEPARPIMRLSSSEANVTLNIEPPNLVTPVDMDSGASHACLPSVPPTTPIGSIAESSLDITCHHVRDSTKSLMSPGSRRRSRKATSSSCSSLLSSSNSSISSCSTSAVSSNRKSQSQSGLIRSSSSSTAGLNSDGAHAQVKGVTGNNKIHEKERASCAVQAAKLIKEIEFAESRTLNDDTSADEDCISVSSSSLSDQAASLPEAVRSKETGAIRQRSEIHERLILGIQSCKISGDIRREQQMAAKKTELRADKKSIKLNASKAKTTTGEESCDFNISKSDRIRENLQPSLTEKQHESPQQYQTPASAGKTLDSNSCTASNYTIGRQSIGPSSRLTTPRSSFQHYNSEHTGERVSKAGVVVCGSTPRVSSRRSSTASSASAFAAATAASNNPILTQPPIMRANPMSKSPLHQVNVNPSHNNQRHVSYDLTSGHADGACQCSSAYRNSVSASSNLTNWPQTRAAHELEPANRAYNQVWAHYPNCMFFQQGAGFSPSSTPSNSYPNVQHSDASSLCNSRASSRLSSTAGLEHGHQYSSCSASVTTGDRSQKSSQVAHCSRGALGAWQGQTVRSVPSRYKKGSSPQVSMRSMATLRVLSVLRHWVSKHSQDFVNDASLARGVQGFLQDLIMDMNLLPAEHKAITQLQQMVQKANQMRAGQVDLDSLLAPPPKPSADSIETLSALEIAEGMTYLDHKIFLAIRSEEFLGQAWMKVDKAIKAPHILLITKRFNDVSRLVSSEIIRIPDLQRRVAIIEKWTNVAHICRVVHNFNGVLQICAAFTNSAVFRLKKTWDKIPKTTKTTIDQLQNLVSTDSRFRNMRDAINRCDPPSIPYVGMYLTDLSFIEEGTPNYSPDGLLNFSKMRMIAHVIREIQHLQNGSYKIQLNQRVANYLLDESRHLQDDEMYRNSLEIEPRSTGGKNGVQILNSFSQQVAQPAILAATTQQTLQSPNQKHLGRAKGND